MFYLRQLSKKTVVFAVSFTLVVLALIGIFIILRQSNLQEESDSTFKQTNYTVKSDDNNLQESDKRFPDSPNSVSSEKPDQSPLKDTSFGDLDIRELQDEDVERIAQQADAVLEVPRHPWRKEVFDNMQKENIKQTIENFANFDDLHLAENSISSGVDSSELSAQFQIHVVTHLTRVRRVLAYGKENPQDVIPELRQVLGDSLAGWADARKKREEDYAKGVCTYSEPDVYMRAQKSCLAATYLLAELGDYDSLPILAHQYRIHHPWPRPVFHAPVPPAITLYAMHRLASSYPRESLSPEATQALDKYLDMANKWFPPPREIMVTVWDALYSEADPRMLITNKKKEVLEGQKSVMLYVYPTRFLDGSNMQDGNGAKSESLDNLFTKLADFVSAVYPSTIRSP